MLKLPPCAHKPTLRKQNYFLYQLLVAHLLVLSWNITAMANKLMTNKRRQATAHKGQVMTILGPSYSKAQAAANPSKLLVPGSSDPQGRAGEGPCRDMWLRGKRKRFSLQTAATNSHQNKTLPFLNFRFDESEPAFEDAPSLPPSMDQPCGRRSDMYKA